MKKKAKRAVSKSMLRRYLAILLAVITVITTIPLSNITLAKAGGINGVAVGVSKKGEEYLRSLPDQNENNNLSSLPTLNE